ncbi:hypothetical protein [Nocardia sp. SYP-A9097]|uniref:hypothetical protein n=1 Tax=Nocardia sp. SYP-A9097 TaxID=2663237 RepID=UPI00129B2616|nr:hypothetical protein [Nocardia sp. SYP-A9097]
MPELGVPQTPRESAIAHQYGSDDIDAVHAARLKAVQDTAFLHAARAAEAGADPAGQSAVYTNKIGEDLRQARHAAERAGITLADIDHAETIGSGGTSWDQQPAHRLLGRLEQLSKQSYQWVGRAIEQNERIEDLTRQLHTAHTTIEELREDLAHTENTTRELLSDVTDHDWHNGTRRRDLAPASQWPQRLKDANTALAAANRLETLDPELPAPENFPIPGAGRDITDAIDAVLPGGGPAGPHGDELTASAPAPDSAGGPDLEVEP